MLQAATAPHPESPIPVTFVDIAKEAGLDIPNVWGGVKHKKYIIEAKGSGLAFFDYDQDGWLDIYLTNGDRLPGEEPYPDGKTPTQHLLKNNRDGTFTDVTEKAGLSRTGWGTGVCVGDYDNDGWDDLFCGYWGHNVLWHNNGDGARLLPVLEGILKALPHAVLSVDTYKASTARAALEAGAEIVNDVSGFTWDAGIAGVCAEFGAGVVLSHTRGRPEEWRAQPQLAPDALLSTVREGLAASLAAAQEAGIAPDQIVVDPGYGFGKRFGENYALLSRQAELLALGRPLLAGLSRKSFLGRTLAPLFGGSDAPIDARGNASLAAMTAAILQGASIVRVHEVRHAVEAACIADAILEAR